MANFTKSIHGCAPTGKSGALATSFAEFTRYFAEGDGQLWERQALTKARVVVSADGAGAEATRLAEEAAYQHRFSPADAAAIRDMRRRLEDASTPTNLKRGAGGIVDIEFLVQMLQLKHGRENTRLRTPNTLLALAALAAAGLIDAADHSFLSDSYRLLRTVECRLRLMNTTARDDLPTDEVETAKLARALAYPSGQALLAECRKCRQGNRARFERYIAAAARG